MIASISGTLMQPQAIPYQNQTAALRKVSQGEEAAESPAERIAELAQSTGQTNSNNAAKPSHSGTLGRNVDFQI
ncbi:hypothetical protein [Dehalobacter sp. TeCB1]|uniref:hypothetical protein n=1 Tax=Dehalobacter sp. TeCB1 TaxID=1843715 RepID=UPI00083A9E8D|nr:hypothetical protein [Dehalobacter sp. TeCB1]OCZ49826.1 hypothetical protein A7D23_00305 [Dehalobacter sp. TeCB1]